MSKLPGVTVGDALSITRANARFQQWEALLRNRSKRHRAREFLVHGVRPISMAVEHGWTVRALIHDAERPLSRWARDLQDRVKAERVAMAPHLIQQLSEKEEGGAELVAVVELPPDDLSRLRVGPGFLGVVFDRPSVPGNIGTLVRSVDAFGGAGVIVTGHGADPYDPRAVRASTGSLFAVPVARVPSHEQVLRWARQRNGPLITVVGTDESAITEVAELDLTGPTLLVVGNETSGLTAAWRDGCDVVARIPMTGSASSLNAASAATVCLYEAARQRRSPR